MNIYKTMNNVYKVLARLFYITLFVYIAYVLCTPGYYGYLVFYGLLVLLCLYLLTKIEDYSKKRESKYTDTELIEHKYAVTYRKRYYSGIYFALLIYVVTSMVVSVGHLLVKQMDITLNTQYVESIEYVFGTTFQDEDFDSTIFKKLTPVTPNTSKQAVVDCADVIRLIVDLSEFIQESKESGVVNEVVLREYEDRVQEYVTYTEDTLQHVESNAVYIILVLLVLRLSTNELRRYLSHRSIELKEY